MLAQPEYEPEFYKEQLKLMTQRFSILFKEWKVSWGKYFDYVSKALRNNIYWLWVYFCGFEKFVKEQGSSEKNIRTRLYKDADSRIARIIGDNFKINNYINSL
jgi:hypothetical protein